MADDKFLTMLAEAGDSLCKAVSDQGISPEDFELSLRGRQAELSKQLELILTQRVSIMYSLARNNPKYVTYADEATKACDLLTALTT